MYNDLIIDFETMGTGQETDDFLVIDVAYLFFDLKASDNFDDLVSKAKRFKFSLDEQKEIGWKAESSTLEWWKTQSKEAIAALKSTDGDVTLREFISEFKSDCRKNKLKRVWSRGTDFDFPIMKRIFRTCDDNVNNVFKYHTVRDIRTYMDVMGGFQLDDLGAIPPTGENVKFTKHNAKHDIAMDVLRLQYFAEGY
jgi:predicted ester cyclase